MMQSDLTTSDNLQGQSPTLNSNVECSWLDRKNIAQQRFEDFHFIKQNYQVSLYIDKANTRLHL